MYFLQLDNVCEIYNYVLFMVWQSNELVKIFVLDEVEEFKL